MGGCLTEEGDVVGRLGNVVGNVEKEDTEGEKHDHSDLHFLRRRAEKDGQEQNCNNNIRDVSIACVLT